MCGAWSTAMVSSGAPARTASRWAVCATLSFTLQPSRSVGRSHWSSGTSRASATNSAIACRQVATSSARRDASFMSAGYSAPFAHAAPEVVRAVPLVDVHGGHQAVAAPPEAREGLGVLALDPQVVEAGGPDVAEVLHAEVELVGEEVRQLVERD